MDDNMIKLELGTTELTLHSEEAVPAVSATKELTEHYLEQQTLSPEEQQQVDAFSEKIDLHDSAIILQYGAACQKKVAAFSDTVLEGVRTKDLTVTGTKMRETGGVVDGGDKLHGLINLKDIRKVLFRQELYNAFTAEQLMTPSPDILSINAPMTYVMDCFEKSGAEVLPVVDENNLFVGLIHKTVLFEAYRQTLVDFSEE